MQFRVFIILATASLHIHLGVNAETGEESSLETEDNKNEVQSTDLAQSLSSLDANENIVRFLVMGDWGAQTNSGKRRLSKDVVEDNETRLLAKENTNNGNSNSNKNNGNNNNNKNNGGEYWSVLIAKAMANYASTYPADFLIALGDNFYNNGVSSTTDSLWTSVYTNVYNYDSLQIPWYAIFGNHDYGTNKGIGSLDAQIEFEDNRWHAGHCYMQSMKLPNSETAIDIVFIDSTLIAPEETYMTSTTSGITATEQETRRDEQLQCLENYLSKSTAQYLIVAGHYPIFSTGKNSPGDMTSMVETVYPLLEKYNVDMYLCGHDHRLEHLSYKTASGGTMDFIISGAAGKPDNQLSTGVTSAATSLFSAATGGFAFAEITDEGLTTKILDYTGTVVYSTYREMTRTPANNRNGKNNNNNNDDRRSSNSGESFKSHTQSAVQSGFGIFAMTGMDTQEISEIAILSVFFLTLVGVIFVVTGPSRKEFPIQASSIDEQKHHHHHHHHHSRRKELRSVSNALRSTSTPTRIGRSHPIEFPHVKKMDLEAFTNDILLSQSKRSIPVVVVYNRNIHGWVTSSPSDAGSEFNGYSWDTPASILTSFVLISLEDRSCSAVAQFLIGTWHVSVAEGYFFTTDLKALILEPILNNIRLSSLNC
eukprot:gene624-1208_t